MAEALKVLMDLIKQQVVASTLLEVRLTELNAHLTSRDSTAIEKCRQDCMASFEAFLDLKVRLSKEAERYSE